MGIFPAPLRLHYSLIFAAVLPTGAEYYGYVVELAKKYGWRHEAEIAGHLIGQFPGLFNQESVVQRLIFRNDRVDIESFRMGGGVGLEFF